MPISRNILDSLISLQPQLATCNIYPYVLFVSPTCTVTSAQQRASVKDTDLDMDLLAFEEKLITKNYKASPASSAFLFVCLSVRISSQIFTVRHPLSKERANGGRSVVRSGHFGLCSALVMHIRYNNEKSSPELEEFLEWLATRVKVRIFVDSFFFFSIFFCYWPHS
jgi:hypothetical protein